MTDLAMAMRKLLEKLADFPAGASVDQLYEASVHFLPTTGSVQVLRFGLFQLECEDRVVKEDRDGVPYFKLTPDGFLKEALHEQECA